MARQLKRVDALLLARILAHEDGVFNAPFSSSGFSDLTDPTSDLKKNRKVTPRKQNMVGLPADSRYAVLFDESAFRKLRKALDARPDVTHVWIVTDSEDARKGCG